MTSSDSKSISSVVLDLMSGGNYKEAAEAVLKYAEKLSVDLLNAKDLEKSDSIVSVYRNLLLLNENTALIELHKKQKMELSNYTNVVGKRTDLSTNIVNLIAQYLDLYRDMDELFISLTMKDNSKHEAIKRLESIIDNKEVDGQYSEKDIMNDIYILLQDIEPTSSFLGFSPRVQKKGQRYKCEKGYDKALNLIEKIQSLIDKLINLDPTLPISYQEIFWKCGSDVSYQVNHIIGFLKRNEY